MQCNTITGRLSLPVVFYFCLFSVLIDDRQDLQQDWEAAGGIFILHTDTTSSLRQLREKGIIKPLPEAKQLENQKAEEPNPATTTTTVISNLITMTTIKPPSEAKQVEKPGAEEPDPATTKSYRLPASALHRLSLILVKGSVLDFDNSLAPAAIVNAANVGCLGGGGVDGAISKAGGRSLDRDRSELPVVADADSGEPVRCPEGQAVVTGPGNYGSLHVPYVIHAVGPNYNDYDDLDDLTPVHNLLKSAYTAALDRAVEHKIQSVAFSLLSAGLYRGSQPLEDVLALGVTAIQEWSVSYANITGVEGDALLSQIVLYAFTSNEYETLKAVCDRILESKPPRAS
jgi:O-acetyl-ADP-ribose deacetylase (regulator of RNase III)